MSLGAAVFRLEEANVALNVLNRELQARLAAYEKAGEDLPEDPELPDTNGEAASEKEWTELYNAFERTTAHLRTIATRLKVERDEARQQNDAINRKLHVALGHGADEEKWHPGELSIDAACRAIFERDAAIAERDRLREELAQEKAFNMECQTLPIDTARQKERDRLLPWLCHSSDCTAFTSGLRDAPCTCGLRKALEGGTK